MATPNALNRDPFLTGGVMDAPDPVVRSAMAKMMNPQGLPPMTQKELNRLLTRQSLESENVRLSNTASQQTMAARQGIASGQMAPIDVRQYAGSMYAAPGSYTAARPMAEATGYNPERSADALLKAQFGQMLPGQQVRIAGIPDEMLVPAGQPEVQPVAQPAAQAPSMTGGSAIEQLLGRNLSLFQAPEPIYQQAPAASTVSQIMQMTPFAQQQRLAQQKFAADQREAQTNQLIDTLASMDALGQDITQFSGSIGADILNRAKVKGEKLKSDTQPKFPAIQETVENGIVYSQRFDPNTGQPVGGRIPERSTAQLPGTAPVQSKGRLVPATNPQTGKPYEGVLLDVDTGKLVNIAVPGFAQQIMGQYGIGLGGQQSGVQQPAAQPPPQIKTYEQVLKELQR
jgi:hypothetical protein